MNLKALITTFVLGSSSVAMAHPISAPTPAPVVRDHRAAADLDCAPITITPAPVVQPAAQPIYRGPMPPQYAPGYQPAVYEPAVYQPHARRASWVTLGAVDRIADGQVAFRVGAGAQFSTLKLQSQAGKSLIQRVLIQFANGRTQVVEVNQYLTASNPAITIDLEGRSRAVAKVTVVGRNARQSAYRVLAI